MGNVTEVFVTGLEVNGSGNSYVPALYSTNSPEIPPNSYFSLTSNNLTYYFSAPPYTDSFRSSTSYEFSTSLGYVSYSFSLGIIIAIAEHSLEIDVPPWVLFIAFIASPGISITTFTSSSESVTSTISLTAESYNTYYAYMLHSNVTYSIGGNSYFLPYYYYYINYTPG